jgi:hypothetical protein
MEGSLSQYLEKNLELFFLTARSNTNNIYLAV